MSLSIFITGAAQGIGAATAQLFVKHGFKVGIYDKNIAQATTLAEQLGQNAHAGFLDVSDETSWKNALNDFIEWAGELNILINNAGILFSGAFENTALDQHLRTIDINVKGVLIGCHSAFEYLKKARFARIINLSSASAIYGQADLASYSASKFAVRGLTEALDVEWQKYGIRVLDVMPLFVQTAMVKDMDAASIQKMGINLSPQDVAEQIFKLAKSSNHLLTPTHTPIGLKTKVLYQLSALSPQMINRLTNLYFSKRA
ncbi:SDR family oxidoreductase [Acinetobacter gerneri]|jgi:NAD(P)-dependent dehydrogenase (short-subunit alcohol dehydrogenase family)|uniref:SDR family oxidoreductase n=1 Tax=Acinetobacter gerneri TaxID=202952 RepID=UPI0023F3BD86|nr:SDR family oxidoreductase [Acinetobacter gerneri]MCH4243928.1 SDR family oxidoreductase [Acinetobacter gerneri]